MGVAELIRKEIAQSGPIPFSRFMDLALYHPTEGYYRRSKDPFGHGGDFFTSSQLQPVFGRLIAQQIDRWRVEMGSPVDFSVLELGTGRGETGNVVRQCLPSVPWHSLDVGDPWPDQPITGVVFSNEFFDALPVDLVERRDAGAAAGWAEWRVDWADDRFAWSLSDDRQSRDRLPEIAVGHRVETCERAMGAMERIASTLRRGYVLSIDYGYTHDEMVRGARFREGSLMSYRAHQADADVLANPGEQDITAHVNFSALSDRGEELSLAAEELRSQQAFLAGIGEADEFAYALSAETEHGATQLRMQLKTLLFGMGETFRVLVQRRT